ncbi:hypothetical protein OB955_05655 [Halobacteria archaeon AArc-m2/3/4]|uniref:Uncharacterized protein n=1 Tax=Natronoglomus mannanivorans TaxID=2979990 RepID=A0AAP2Z0W3_9EURY|nr:hypothetical protein [Halobacteria archaeon AArc-xg1-1]MCU4972219.1 hypothetical protein [Halobacteria archaeon AArc-m2/3/4]
MALQRMFSGNPARSSMLYLGIGVLSLVKAIAVRKDPDRFRRELVDAGLFIGAGLVLRQYSQLKEEKRAEMQERLPAWLSPDSGSGSTGSGSGSGLRGRAMQRFSSEPEPEPTFTERAQRAIQGRQ